MVELIMVYVNEERHTRGVTIVIEDVESTGYYMNIFKNEGEKVVAVYFNYR